MPKRKRFYGLGIVICLSPLYVVATEPLTFQKALEIAFEKNLDIKIAKLDEDLGQSFIDLSKAPFDVTFTSLLDYKDDQDKPTSTIIGTRNISKNVNLGLVKKVGHFGTTIDLQSLNRYKRSNSLFSSIPRYWDPQIVLTLTQPLLHNSFGYSDRRKLRQGILKDKLLKQHSKEKIETILALAATRYWELSAAQSHLKIKETALAQAKKLLDANKKKLKLGTLEETDLLASRANVHARENDFLSAQGSYNIAQMNLKHVLNNETDESISETELLLFTETHVSPNVAISHALNQRKEYLALKENLKLKKVASSISKNALLPKVDIIGSVAYNGLDEDYRAAIAEVRELDFPIYYAGIQISYPLGNHAAKSSDKQSRVEKLAAHYQLQKLENDIRVDISKKIELLKIYTLQAKATDEITGLLKQKMIAEEKKFNQGRSSINFVIQFQEDYLHSSSGHLEALLTHKKALIDLQKSEGTLLDTYLSFLVKEP